MVVMMVVVGMDDHDNLRLRRIGDCEAEKKYDSEQNLFHNSVSLRANQNTEQL